MLSFVGFVFICSISTAGPCTRTNSSQVIALPGPAFTNKTSLGFAGPPCVQAALKYGRTLKLGAGMKFGVGCELVKRP